MNTPLKVPVGETVDSPAKMPVLSDGIADLPAVRAEQTLETKVLPIEAPIPTDEMSELMAERSDEEDEK
jgi:hypothetical protein